MKNSSPRSIVKRFVFKNCLIFTAAIALIIYFYAALIRGTIGLYIYASLLILIALFTIMLCSRIFNKDIRSILTKELDAEKLQDVCRARALHAHIGIKYTAAALSGDYQTAVNICNAILSGNTGPAIKCIYAAELACIYFELSDIKRMSEACDAFDHHLTRCKGHKKTKKLYGWTMRFLSSYANEEYEACAEMCREREKELLADPIKNKLRLTSIDLYYIAVYYKLGDTEKCRYYCEKLIEEAPKLYRARIAEKYLKVLETQDEELLNPCEIFPDQSITKTVERSNLYNRIIRIAFIISFIGICLFSIVYIINYTNYKIELKAFEEKLESAVYDRYEETQSVEYMDLKFNEEVSCTVCIIVDDNGSINLAVLVSFDNGETFELFVIAKDVKIGEPGFWEHSPDVAPGDYVEYAIVDRSSDVPKDAVGKVKIKVNGEKKYFYMRFSK